MLGIERTITALGGLAQTFELLAHGHDLSTILLFAEYGRIVRVRKGWYATHATDGAVIRACRVGGVLACASALAFHGRGVHDELLHVAVGRSSARLRTPDDQRVRLVDDQDSGVVLHWSRRPPSGDRRAVSVSEALLQWRACRARLLAAGTG